MAVECLLKTGLCMIAGEVTTQSSLILVRSLEQSIATKLAMTLKFMALMPRPALFSRRLKSKVLMLLWGVNASADKEQGAGIRA